MRKFATCTVNDNNRKAVLLIIMGLFVACMFLASGSTSPLYPYSFSGDASIFALIGKGIVNGKMPYVDLFDHKGPVLFFIEALGYGIAGRTGIFILQCMFGCVNLFYMYKTWLLVREKQGESLFIDLTFTLIAMYSVFFYTFEGGNLTEEYSLPLISMCLYFMTKYAFNVKEEGTHSYAYSFCYGICISVLAFIRLNNAVTICAGVLAIAIYLLYRKKYKNLFMNILFGFMGVVLIALPIILYFAINSALYDMIYATFIHNFQYAGVASHKSILQEPIKYIILYMPIFLSFVLMTVNVVKMEKKIELEFFDILIYCIVIFNLMCLIIGNSYAHYFTIYVPVFALIVGRYWKSKFKNVITIMLAVCVVANSFFVAKYVATVIYNNILTNDCKSQHEEIEQVVSVIPENERDSVIGYNIHARYYIHSDIIPCYKYYTFQKWWSVSNPSINIEFMEWLKNEKPLWVIKHPKENEKELIAILNESYELKRENTFLSVYRLKE